MQFEKRAKNALNANGFTNTLTVDNHITPHGSDWYFAVCAVMIVSTGAFMGLSCTKLRTERVFHHITAAITLVAAVAYFSMGANLGWTGIHVEFMRSSSLVSGNIRQIFYVRYIDWVITTPLLLLDLLLACGLPAPTILYTILIDEIMIATGLIGALVKSSYKWGYFTFGCVAFLFVAWTVVFEGRAHARALGADISKVYLVCGVWTIFLWFLYPISWGLSEGGNVIASDSEAVFYGVLDIMAKPVFGALLIWGHRNIDPTRLGLDIKDPGMTDSGLGGSKRDMKAAGAGNATNGTSATNRVTSSHDAGAHPEPNTTTKTV